MDNKRKISYRKATFLKILQDDFINKLPIPLAFTRIFGEETPPWFILEIAGTRKCWRVDIEEDDNGSLYLGYGFNCFVKAHSLETGNFLLFQHVNPSILEVKIYEKDGSERTTEMTFESEYEIGAASETSTEIPIINQERNETPSLSSHIMTRKFNSYTFNSLNCNFEPEYEVKAASESPTGTPIIHQEVNASPCLTSHTMTSVQFRSSKKQRGVIGNGGNKRKKCFMSATEQNVCFSLTWRKAPHFHYYLTIPRVMLSGKSFSNKEEVTVTNGEGNSWQVELRIRLDGRVDFARGWKEFVDDNDLENGDTLTFKFVSDNEIQVNVKRASQVNDPFQMEREGINQPYENMNLICEDGQLADVCNPSDKVPLNINESERVASISNSSFSYTWTDKTRYLYLHIPRAIVNKQKLKNNDIVILCDPKGKQWLVEVNTRPCDGSAGLSRGWSDFTRAYGFEPGDTLNFVFVTDRMIKVNVLKACDLENPSSGAAVKQEVLKLDDFL